MVQQMSPVLDLLQNNWAELLKLKAYTQIAVDYDTL
jgi:hypothetical protein